MDCAYIHPDGFVPALVLIFVALALFASFIWTLIKTWLNCVIFHKAGYSWAWGLLTLVPIANIIIPFMLALGDWPVNRELRRLKDAAKTQTI
jgi:hypothetical protein